MLKFAIKILGQEFLKQRMKYVERQRKVSSVRNMKVKPTLEGNKVYESLFQSFPTSIGNKICTVTI